MPYTFCPQCATRLSPRTLDGVERLVCSECGWVFYDNSLPCVGVLALREGKVLLVKRAVPPFEGYWDIPGGFLESGEHPEEGARREFLEETGLHIEPTELLGFFMDVYGEEEQPTLNVCYLARLKGGEEKAGSDAADIGWFPLDALPERIAFNWEQEALALLRERIRGADR